MSFLAYLRATRAVAAVEKHYFYETIYFSFAKAMIEKHIGSRKRELFIQSQIFKCKTTNRQTLKLDLALQQTNGMKQFGTMRFFYRFQIKIPKIFCASFSYSSP